MTIVISYDRLDIIYVAPLLAEIAEVSQHGLEHGFRTLTVQKRRIGERLFDRFRDMEFKRNVRF